MTPLFPAQRAAEEFDQVLGGTSTIAVSDRYAELLEAVEVLRTQPEVVPRAEFAVALRAQLMAAAETDLVRAPPVVLDFETSRQTRRRRRVGTVAASLVIIGGSAGMAAAASGSLPGEPLYPVKRVLEEASSAVRMDEANKGEALLDQARTRLAEVADLQARGSADSGLVATTLADYQSAADQGADQLFTAYQAEGDTADIETVRTFTTTEMAEVGALAKVAGPDVAGMLVDVADTLADIDQQARVLCSTCGPDGAVEPPAALAAGAAADTVDDLLSGPVAQARADVAAAEAARIAGLQRLQTAAEASAGSVPHATTDTTPGQTAPAAGDGVASRLIARDTAIAPSLSDGTAVTGLVSGVTASVDGATGVLTDATGKATGSGPLPDPPAVKDVTGGTAGDVLP